MVCHLSLLAISKFTLLVYPVTWITTLGSSIASLFYARFHDHYLKYFIQEVDGIKFLETWTTYLVFKSGKEGDRMNLGRMLRMEAWLVGRRREAQPGLVTSKRWEPWLLIIRWNLEGAVQIRVVYRSRIESDRSGPKID